MQAKQSLASLRVGRDGDVLIGTLVIRRGLEGIVLGCRVLEA